MAVPDDEWLTVEQAAALMRCGRTRVFGLIGDGTLPSIRPGRARLINRADVVRYLETLRAAGSTSPADREPVSGRE